PTLAISQAERHIGTMIVTFSRWQSSTNTKSELVTPPLQMSRKTKAKKTASEQIGHMKKEAERQILDRKIRQLQIDLPELEDELHRGDAPAQVKSKLARLEAILDELQNSDWLSRTIESQHPDWAEHAQSVRESLERFKAATEER
ncbi:MAG: hypothetical protein AAF492_18675, partial [Verrucomicrobiota bacterium]